MTGQSQQQVAQQQAGGGSASSGGTALLPHPPATYMQQFYAQQALAAELRKFWAQMMQDVEEHSEALVDFKNQALPLARIKKIMKSDEDVRMISAEAPVLFARACEYFIQELTIRSWSAAQEFKRRTLQRSDVATAISRTDIFDFLVDIVPREEANEQPGRDGAAAGLPLGATPSLQLGQAPPLPPLAMYSPGPQPGQQQQFVPPPGGQQFMPPPQQGGPGGGPTMLSYNLPPFIAPPLFSFPLGGPSQQPGPGQLLPGMQFPPPQ